MIKFALAFLCFIVSGVAAEASDAPATIAVSEAWVRASLGQSPTTAAYLKIENRGTVEDRLVSISTPVAAMAHLHESVSKNGIMQMQAVNSMVIKPGQTITFAPGGLHIMVMNLNSTLKSGQVVPLTVRFEQAGEIKIDAAVKGIGDAK